MWTRILTAGLACRVLISRESRGERGRGRKRAQEFHRGSSSIRWISRCIPPPRAERNCAGWCVMPGVWKEPGPAREKR